MATEEYIFKERTAKETARLNQQHEVIVRFCNGKLIHPTIWLDTLKSVADVGTGTGIWLEEVAALVGNDGTRFDGFDISADQFPPESNRVGNYSVQDILKPFPEQYHEVYDLVHVRYLLGALKIEDFHTAARNIFQLLKPGGSIQWEELDLAPISQPYDRKPRNREFMTLFIKFVQSRGFSATASANLAPAFKAAGFDNIIVEERNGHWYQDEESQNEMSKCYEGFLTGVLPVVCLHSGKAKDMREAAGMLPAYMEECLEECRRFGAMNLAHRVAAGRKPEGLEA